VVYTVSGMIMLMLRMSSRAYVGVEGKVVLYQDLNNLVNISADGRLKGTII
jgi:hypothetical protein